MKHRFVSAAFAMALCACAETAPETSSESDAVEPEIADAAVALAIEIANVGAACSDAQTCNGIRPECMTRSSTASVYAGGYCTAACVSDVQCGAGGICPVAEAERDQPRYDFINTWPRKCFRSCTPGPSSGCRPEYRCASLADVYHRPNAPAAMHRPICIPLANSGDGDSARSDAGT